MILPSHQTLQHLHIHTMTQDFDDVLVDLLAEFKAMAGHNVIESISIDITVLHDDDHDVNPGNTWGALDRALTQRNSGWANLRSVSLTIELVRYWNNFARREELEEALKKLPESQMKGLVNSEDIKFELKVTSSFWEYWI